MGVVDTLQYLEQDDLKRYLAHLVAHQQHFTQDQTYLRVTHAEHLKPVKGDKKKDVEWVSSLTDIHSYTDGHMSDTRTASCTTSSRMSMLLTSRASKSRSSNHLISCHQT